MIPILNKSMHEKWDYAMNDNLYDLYRLYFLASDDNTESVGCIGFSAIEIIEPCPDTPSVVEILAAMALGPMLAVPSGDQPATLTVSDYNAFTDLKELALAEIKARALELTPRNLDVIPEEPGDVTNQTENLTDSHESNSLIDQEKNNTKTENFIIDNNLNSSQISFTISEPEACDTKISNIQLPENFDHAMNEIITNSSTLISTKSDLDNSHLDMDENTVTEELNQMISQEQQASINDKIELVYSKSNIENNEQTSNKTTYEINSGMHLKDETLSVNEKSNNENNINDDYLKENSTQQNVVILDQIESGRSELAESISQEQPFETQQEDNKIISVNHLSETLLEDKSNSTNHHALTLCLEQSVQNLLVKKHNSVEPQTEPNKEISIEEISEVPSSFEISLNDTEDSGLILPEKLSEIPLEYKLDFDKNVIEPIIEEAISFDKTILKQETIETNSEITDVTKNEKSSEISFKDIPNLTYNKTSSVSTEFTNDSVTKEQFGETQIEIDTTDSTLERDIESKIEENTLTKQLAVVDEQIPKETHFETQTEDILNSMNNKDTLSYRENCLQLQREKGTLNQPIESQPDDFSESMNNKESYLSLEPSMQYTNKEDILVEKLVVVDETEQPNEIHAVDTLESIKTEDIFLCLEVNSLTEQPAASDEEMSKDGHLEIHSDKTPDSTNNKVYSIGSALSIEECTSHAQSTDSKTQTSETIPEDVSNFEQEKTMSGEQSNEVYEKMSKDQPTQIPAEETGRMMPAFPKHSVKSISVECPSVEQPAKDNIIVSEEQSKIINEIVSKAQKIETQPGTNSDNIETDDASAEQSTKIWEDSLDFIKKEDLSTKTQNSSKCQNRNVESKTDECTLVKKSNEENSETFPESISIFTNVEPIEQYKSENFSTGLCRSEELKSEKKPSTENVAVNVEENSEVKQPETQADDSLNPISEVSLNFSEHHPEKDFEKSVHCNKTSLASIDPSTQSEMGDGSTADEQSKVGDNLAFIEQTSETLQESTTGAFIETKQNSIGKCTLYEHLKVNGEKISEEHSSEVNTSDSANNETSPGFSKVIVQYKIGDTASHKVSTIIHETISNEMQCETLAENILEFAKNENSYTSQESCVVYRTECSSPAKVVEYITYTYTNENQTENILNSDSLECTSSDPSEVIVEEITDSSETKTVGPLEMTENDDTLICPERIAEYKIDKCTSTERLTAEVEISHNIPENSIESSVESKTKECTSADLSTVLLEKITNNQPFEIQPENNLDSMKNEDTSSYSEHSVESKTEDYTSAVISAVFVGQITNLTETKPEDTLDLMNNDYSSACQERSVESKSEDCISSEHSVVVTVHLENTVESTNNENISPTSEHSAVFIEQITNGQICETQPEKTLNDIENERTSACSEHSVECKTDEVTSVKHSTGVVEQRSEQFSENCPEDTLGSKKNEDTLTCAELSVGSKTAECSSAETLGENALDGMKNEDNSTCICKSKGYTSAEHLTVVDEQITNDQLFETQTQNTLEYMKNEDSSVQDSVAAIEQIANDQLCETEPENTLDSKKNEETSMCPGYSEESKTEECTSVEHSREVAKKNTNEQISGIQTGSPFDCMKKEFSLSEDSAKVAEPIKNKQFSESPPENNLDSMKSKNTHENPEHDLESKSVGYITDEQKNEERMCPGYSEESKTEECTSVEHSIVVDKKNTNEQISGIQTGSPFDCIKKEFSLSEDSAKVAEPIKNEQFSESPPENNLDSMKIKNTHENPEHDLESKNVGYITDEHSVEDVALVTYQQPLEIQPGDALHSTNISSQSEESNSAEHSTVVIEQITKEQPSETQHENTLDSMNKESVCQERSMESKIEKWPSAEVDAQITNQQPSDTQTEDTLHFTKNDSQSEETTVVIEQITNEQPSDIQSKNTLEYTKKEDCSVGPEHSIQLKTGMCTSADFPSVSVEQITNEQPSETKAAEHLKVVIDQITKKQLSETEHKNILDSLKKEDCSVCPQRSMESKLEECPSTGPLVEVVVQITNQQISEILPEDIVQSTKNDSQGEESNSAKHSKVDIEQIKNKQSNSAEHSTVTVEHITNEQPSKTQSKNTLDSMKNGDCLTRPEQSVQLKTEVYTSADPSSVVVEQITNEQPSETNSAVHSIVVIAQITKEQISETQHVNTLDSVKKEVYSVCLERSMASKFEECPSVKDVPQIINQQSGEIQPKDILHSTENDSQNEESNSAEHSTVIVEHISNEQPSEIQHENTLDSMKNGDCLACPEQSMQLKTEVCTSADLSSVVVEQIINEQPSETYSAEHSKVVVEQITKEQLSKTQHVNTLDSVKKEEHSVCPERSMESKLEECPSTGLLVEVVAQITNEQPSETNTAEHSKVVVEQLTNEQSSETQPESNLYSMEKKDCSVCPEHSMESKLINQQSAEIQPKDILHSTENDSQNEESNAAEHSTVIVEHISNEQPSEIQHENTLDSMKNGDCLACPEQSMQLKTEVCTSSDRPSVVVEQITNVLPSENQREVSSAENSAVVVEQINNNQLKKIHCLISPEHMAFKTKLSLTCSENEEEECISDEDSAEATEQILKYDFSETQPEMILNSKRNDDTSKCQEGDVKFNIMECSSDEYLTKDVEEIINVQTYETQMESTIHSTKNESKTEGTVVVARTTNDQISDTKPENTLEFTKNEDTSCAKQSAKSKKDHCTSVKHSLVIVEQISNELISQIQQKNEDSSASLESKTEECTSAENATAVIEEITSEQTAEMQMQNTLEATKNENCSTCTKCGIESKPEEFTSPDPLILVVETIINELISETQHKSYNSYLETKAEECTSAKDSVAVIERIASEIISETQPQATLKSMKNVDCSISSEHSVEFQTEECTSSEHSALVFEQSTNDQPSETQLEDILHSVERTSAEHSTIFIEEFKRKQASNNQPENSLDSSAEFVQQATNEQSSETQLKNSLDSIKNTDSWTCPETKAEKNFEESAEVTEQIENFQLLATQEENILVSKKYDGDLESKSKECTSDEFSSEVVQQILNEQPSENKLNNTLHSLKNEDFSACPEESEEYTFETQPEYTLESINNEYSLTCLETKTKECTSAEDTAIVFEQIKIKQNCKHQLQNTLDSMKNADCAGFPERSLESKSEECTSTEHSSIITELITNAQPSETKPENTIESMKNADCMESLEPKTEYLSKAQKNDILHSAESKTEKCASAKDSTVIAKQNNCEQPSETQLKNTLDSIKNEDYAACPERTFKSKTEEHTFADPSAVDFDQVKIEQTYETQLHSTLESMKNYDFSECHERFLESKAKVYSVEESKVFDEAMSKDQPIKTKHEHITDVIFETTIDNGESPVACSEISMRCSIGEDDINDESTVLNEQIFDGQSSRVQRQGISDSKKNEISSISVHSSTQSKTKKYTSVQHPIVYGKNSKEQFFEIQSNGTSDCMRNEDSPEQIAESKIEVINKTITEKQYFAAQTNEPSSDIPKPSLEAKTKENTTNKHTVVLTETQSEVTLDYTLCTKSSEETKTEGSMSVCLQPKLESKADECPLEKQSTVDDKIIAKQQDFTKMPAQNTSDFLELNLESKFEECYGAKQSEAVNIQTLEVITHSSNNETSLDSTHNTLPKIEGYTSAVHPTVAVLKTFEDHQFKVEMEPNDTIPNDILHEIPLKGISDLMNIKTLTISSKIQYKIRESTSDNKSIVCEEIIKQSSKNEPELKQIILKELSSDVLTESISDSKSCMQPTIENNGTENKQEIVILDYTHNDISLTCQPKAENSNSSETQIESSELFSKGNSLKIQDLIVNSTPKEYTIKKQRKLSDTNSKDQSSESQAENKKQISKEQISEIPFGDTLDSTIHESSSENSVQYKAKECTSKTVNDKRFSKKHRSESQTKTNETISNERSTFHDETYLKDQILETQTEINNKIPNVQSSEMSFEGLSISTSSEASTKSSASGLQYKTEESTSVEQIAVLDETISKDLTSESEPETNKIISREESSEKLIDNFSTDPANNKKVLESSSEIHTKKEACLESKPINNNETQIESNLCQIPDVIDLPKEITTLNVMEDYVLFNDTPSITRQYTVVNIEGKEKRTEECHNKLSNSLSASEPNETSGSIAEREYKKWYNAVEMPNNPYAPEALKRRISGSQERFIDLPNISPIKDLNPLELLNTEKLDSDENATRESDYKRYSRDYYINSSLTTPQMSPARDVSVNVIKDNQEPSKEQLPTIEIEAKHDLYKAIPAQVEESGNLSSMEYTSERSIELETNDTTTTTTSDSDTIKMYDIEKEQKIHNHTTEETTNEEDKNKEGPTSLAFSKTESCGNVITPTRGTTPMAFKFLQPKRKLLEPSQVLSVDDDDEQQTVTSPLEKPVIEAEVAKALPSVKALARAFLMTTNSTQPEKLWLRKARTLSQGSKKRTYSPKRSLDIQMRTKQLPKLEDDITITSDLSSLETDSSSVGIELSSTPTDLTISAESSSNDAPAPGNISPVPVREGVLKNNIAFFENLKNK